jgi:hypothetical protein
LALVGEDLRGRELDPARRREQLAEAGVGGAPVADRLLARGVVAERPRALRGLGGGSHRRHVQPSRVEEVLVLGDEVERRARELPVAFGLPAPDRDLDQAVRVVSHEHRVAAGP